MTLKQERKEQTHSAILGAATRVLRKRGVAGAGVAEVMRAAGLTVGGFYAHFPSKDALLDDAIRRIGFLNRDRLFSGLDDKPAAAQALVVLKRYLRADNRDDEEGCPLPSVVGEIATTATAQRGALADVVDGFARELGRLGVSRPTALGLVALMVGGLSLARALRGTPLSDEILSAARAVGAAAVKESR